MLSNKKEKKFIESYKSRELLGFSKNLLVYILSKHQPLYFLKNLFKYKKRKDIKIFYIDYFTPENSNFYWLRAFRKVGQVMIFDVGKDNLKKLQSKILDFKPDHIHLGGSVKDNHITPQFLAGLKEKLNFTASAFYGDGSYSFYHFKLAEIVDYIYLSNKTHIKINQERGLNNFKYMPCPTYPDIFNHQKGRKIYEIIFIGNNNRSERLILLKKIAERYNLRVFGNGWEKTGLDWGSPVYGKDFSRICSQAKICLGEKQPSCAELEACFSNRLINTLATGSFYVNPYSRNLESIFTNREHLVWYENEEELFKLIDYYLENPRERERIAREGQKEVYAKYTYDKSVKIILKNVGIK